MMFQKTLEQPFHLNIEHISMFYYCLAKVQQHRGGDRGRLEESQGAGEEIEVKACTQ